GCRVPTKGTPRPCCARPCGALLARLCARGAHFPALLCSVASGRRPVFGAGGGRSKGRLCLQDVAERLRTGACQRVVVMVGAGISTPSGIPDFRTFNDSTRLCPFRRGASSLGGVPVLRAVGRSCALGLLLVSGIPASKLVEAHGSFASATCTVCRRPSPGESFWADVLADTVPRCPVCTGIVKPDIVFFGEPLPQRFLLHVVDFPMADLLLILGTSLEVEPFASLSEAVRSSVPRLLINRDLVGPLAWSPRSRDVVQLGDVVQGVERLVELLGWTAELQDLVQRETGKLGGADR
ncbi:PREDICTED: NAD-dependent protein deacetylase sirtuin-3, mitochondrial, partial [Condylura cristata]|uniref:NAD-dependent protein deacetylase sirtuin-3, mitochondrial n=1 Tax=Condylura cristata TaxID=143302 RepID=UPI0006429FF4